MTFCVPSRIKADVRLSSL